MDAKISGMESARRPQAATDPIADPRGGAPVIVPFPDVLRAVHAPAAPDAPASPDATRPEATAASSAPDATRPDAAAARRTVEAGSHEARSAREGAVRPTPLSARGIPEGRDGIREAAPARSVTDIMPVDTRRGSKPTTPRVDSDPGQRAASAPSAGSQESASIPAPSRPGMVGGRVAARAPGARVAAPDRASVGGDASRRAPRTEVPASPAGSKATEPADRATPELDGPVDARVREARTLPREAVRFEGPQPRPSGVPSPPPSAASVLRAAVEPLVLDLERAGQLVASGPRPISRAGIPASAPTDASSRGSTGATAPGRSPAASPAPADGAVPGAPTPPRADPPSSTGRDVPRTDRHAGPPADTAPAPPAASDSPRATEEAATPPARSSAPAGGSAPGAPLSPVRLATPGPAAETSPFVPPRTLEILLRVLPGYENQLALRAHELAERGRTEMRVVLDPPTLGRLKVRLTVSEGEAVARISAATPEAAALLMRDRADLLRAFEQQGFAKVEVHVDSHRHDEGAGRREADDYPESAPAPPITPLARRRPSPGVARRVDLFV